MLYKIIALHGNLNTKLAHISYLHIEENGGNWTLVNTSLSLQKQIDIGFTATIHSLLQMPITAYNVLNADVSNKLATEVATFIAENELEHKIDFVAFGNLYITDEVQLGNGAYLAAHLQLPVIDNFDTINTALGGNTNILAIANTLLNITSILTADYTNTALALLATLRWREAYNVLQQHTNASRNHIAGTIWLGVEA